MQLLQPDHLQLVTPPRLLGEPLGFALQLPVLLQAISGLPLPSSDSVSVLVVVYSVPRKRLR